MVSFFINVIVHIYFSLPVRVIFLWPWGHSGPQVVRCHRLRDKIFLSPIYVGTGSSVPHASYYTSNVLAALMPAKTSFVSSLLSRFFSESSPRLRRRCLRHLARFARRQGFLVSRRDDVVVFEVVHGFNTECAYLYFLLPFITLADHGDVLVIQAPHWVWRAFIALPQSTCEELAPVKIGSQTYAPSPDLLACALKLWDVDMDSPYYQFAAAMIAAERLT